MEIIIDHYRIASHFIPGRSVLKIAPIGIDKCHLGALLGVLMRQNKKTFNEKQIEVGRNIMMLQRYLEAGQRDAKHVERKAKLLSSNLLTLKELIKSELELASKH